MNEALSRRPRLARAGTLVLAVVSVGLLTAACGGGSASPGVASAGPTSTTLAAGNSGAPISPTMAKAQLKYSTCMRANGVPDYPDPNPGGGWSRSGFQTIDQSSLAFLAASKHCAYLDKAAGLTPEPASQLDKHVAVALEVAECMRDHGISNFPDPNSLGGFMWPVGSVSNEPGYAAAAKKCGGPPA